MMDQQTWQSSTRLYELFAFVQPWLSERKRRLFAVACCRRLYHLLNDQRCRDALDVIERYALGLESEKTLLATEQEVFLCHLEASEREVVALKGGPPWNRTDELITQAINLAASHGVYAALSAADHARWALSTSGGGWLAEQAEEAAQCDLLRELVGPFPFSRMTINPLWCVDNDYAVEQLCLAIEQGDSTLYPILADALEDAGCSDSTLLDHCRENSDHVRGCWLVDLLLRRD